MTFESRSLITSPNSWIAVFLFLANPLLGIVFIIFQIISNKGKYESSFFLLYLMISLYLGFIISTKVPVSDWLNYKNYFERAYETSLSRYLSIHWQEPVFFISTFLLSKLLLGNFAIYAIIIISIGYYLVFISIHKFWRYLTNDYFIILFSILIFAFFNNHFSNSGHLTRQVLAGSIFIYFAVNKILYGKIIWFALLTAPFIHTTSIIFFIPLFLPKVNNKLNLKNILTLSISIFLFLMLLQYLLPYVTPAIRDIDWLYYGLDRMEQIEDFRSTWYHGTGQYMRLYYFILLLIAVKAYFLLSNDLKNFKVFSLMNLFFLVVVLFEYFYHSKQYYILLRMSSYAYFFIPFILPFLFINTKSYIDSMKFRPIQHILIILSVFRFFYGLANGNFQYRSVFEILSFPPILYIIK